MYKRQELVGAAIAKFQPSIDAMQVNVNESPSAVLKAPHIASHKALVDFRDAVIEGIETWVRAKHIGWQDQNPHEAHIHLPMLTAIQTVVQRWQVLKVEDYAKIRVPVEAVVNSLSTPHAYEERWDMDARLIREGHDPVGGYEHCFTIAASDDELSLIHI